MEGEVVVDALILSCGTGGGHDAVARAIQETYANHGKHTVMMNPYNLRSEKTARLIDQTYIRLVQKCPSLFGFIYAIGNLYRRLPLRSPVYHCNRKAAVALEAYLRQHPADIILCTHVFPAEILTQMRDQGMNVPPSIFIATDYTCIPFTEETSCDAYVIPTRQHQAEFVERGIPATKLHPLGIPISAAFHDGISQQQAKEILGLDVKKRYILLCGGSMGAGDLMQIAKELHSRKPTDTELIVISGSNERLHTRLQNVLGNSIRLMRRVDNMALYLRACDMYMTKPGGLSTTEAAVMGKPLVHLPPIPGCEARNAAFFSANGMSMKTRKGAQALDEVFSLLEDIPRQERMIYCQHKMIPQDAAEAIFDLAKEFRS